MMSTKAATTTEGRTNPVTRTWVQEALFRFRKSRLAMAGIAVLLILYTLAIFAPVLAPYDYGEILGGEYRFRPPSREFLLGTDHLGRDIWSRVLFGSRISLSIGFVSAGIAVVVGSLIGAVSGYYGGKVDNLLMRFTEIVMAFPVFFLLLTIRALVSPSIFNIMLVIGLTSWPGLARIVRGQVLSIRECDYTQACRALGTGDSRIILRHILPNTLAPIIVSATLRIGASILTETSLSFLGLGAPPPYPSWGGILSQGRGYMRSAPWISTIPGLFIFITVLAFNYVGDGLRDALDPKLKK